MPIKRKKKGKSKSFIKQSESGKVVDHIRSFPTRINAPGSQPELVHLVGLMGFMVHAGLLAPVYGRIEMHTHANRNSVPSLRYMQELMYEGLKNVSRRKGARLRDLGLPAWVPFRRSGTDRHGKHVGDTSAKAQLLHAVSWKTICEWTVWLGPLPYEDVVRRPSCRLGSLDSRRLMKSWHLVTGIPRIREFGNLKSKNAMHRWPPFGPWPGFVQIAIVSA
jgi:hypothetical protein